MVKNKRKPLEIGTFSYFQGVFTLVPVAGVEATIKYYISVYVRFFTPFLHFTVQILVKLVSIPLLSLCTNMGVNILCYSR